MLDIALLGTGGMMPLPHRFLTSLLVRYQGRFFMIDCGEGTQVTQKMLGWGFKSLEVLCFTHFHADHISGLPGLLLAVGNAGRQEPLHLIGPPGLGHVVKSLLVIAPELPFSLVFHTLPSDGTQKRGSLHIGDLEIDALPLNHRIDCFAYRFLLRRKGKFDIARAQALHLPVRCWSILQKQGHLLYEGVHYTADQVMGPERKPLRICYCTDSRPVPSLPAFIQEADLFICEGLYGEEEKAEQAAAYHHMTFQEAAKIAALGQVKELWLTHYSPALLNPAEFLDSARQIFPDTLPGKDRMTKTISFENE